MFNNQQTSPDRQGGEPQKIRDTSPLPEKPPTLAEIMLLSRQSTNDSPAFHYQVAGRSVASDRPLPLLAPFAQVVHSRYPSPDRPMNPLPTGTTQRLYSGPGWIGGRSRLINASTEADWVYLEVAGFTTLQIDPSGQRVELHRSAQDASFETLEQILLGPGLALALARRGQYCLHASAIGTEQGVTAFLGPASAGKSTLAEFVHQSALPPHRVSDDILVVDDQLGVWPAYPQLKLPAQDQWHSHRSPCLPLRQVFLLAPTDDWRVDTQIRRLSFQDAVLALVRHTIASIIFPPTLLAAHLDACHQIARSLPISLLRYRRDLDRLPDLAKTLISRAGD